MKRVMVIAGGTWQVPLIKKVKSLGYEVVNSNLYEDSIGFKYADFTGVMEETKRRIWHWQRNIRLMQC